MTAEFVRPNTIRVGLRVLGETIEAEAPQPEGPVRLDEPLTFLRALEDRVIDITVRQVQAEGAVISCCKGCAACCKAQPVPVTPPEAYALLRLVESLPPPRQTEIRARFVDRVNRLREAGLADTFLDRKPGVSQDMARDIATRYFRLGLACPFLDDDSCSIYADRPFVCRQYLVTSPAANCRDPFTYKVQPVRMPIAAAGATLAVAEKMLGRPQFTVPLTLALDYAEAHRQELEQMFDAKEVFQTWLGALTGESQPRE